MNKNAFTPDGGPHRMNRILDVSDGLKRMGEFEAAEMLVKYADLLHERESAKELPRYTEWLHLREKGVWSNGVPAWAKDHKGHMNDYRAAVAVIDELAAAVSPMLASARVPEAELTALKNLAYDMRQQAGNNNRLTHIGWAQRVERVIAMLAAASKTETGE